MEDVAGVGEKFRFRLDLDEFVRGEFEFVEERGGGARGEGLPEVGVEFGEVRGGTELLEEGLGRGGDGVVLWRERN